MSARRPVESGLKRAEQVAEQIEQRIVEMGWPVGELVGSEQSLIDDYTVSRGVLREAVRLLEHHGTARMRRGPGGGLIVSPPDLRAVRRSAALYLRYGKTDINSLSTARKILELNCLELVAKRMHDPAVASRLRRVLGMETDYDPSSRAGSARILRNFHLELAELADNAAISLFAEILMELHSEFTAESLPGRSPDEVLTVDAGESHRAHSLIYQALADGDVERAKARMARHLDGIAKYTIDHAETLPPGTS